MSEVTRYVQAPVEVLKLPPEVLQKVKLRRNRNTRMAIFIPIIFSLLVAIFGAASGLYLPSWGILALVVSGFISGFCAIDAGLAPEWGPITRQATKELQLRSFPVVKITEELIKDKNNTVYRVRFVIESPDVPGDVHSNERVRHDEVLIPVKFMSWHDGTSPECTQPMVVRLTHAYYYLDSDHDRTWSDRAAVFLDTNRISPAT